MERELFLINEKHSLHNKLITQYLQKVDGKEIIKTESAIWKVEQELKELRKNGRTKTD